LLEGVNDSGWGGELPLAPNLSKGLGYVHLPSNVIEGIARSSSLDSFGQPAVFLDRDGVLIEDMGFLRKPEDIRILPGVTQALRLLAAKFRLVVTTNQSGIARGLFNEETLLEIHQHLAKLLAAKGVAIDAYYYCPHLEGGTVTAYRVECECRKPKPGMLQQASINMGLSLADSYMVGDNPRDAQAGLSAGAKGVIIGETGAGCSNFVMVAKNMLEAAELILADRPESNDSKSDMIGNSAGSITMSNREKRSCSL